MVCNNDLSLGGLQVSVVIPTMNAAAVIDDLLDKLSAQTFAAQEIIVVDSESDDDTVERCRRHSGVRLIEIRRKDFDHGGTRDMAVRQATGNIIVFLTQDAVPADDRLIEKLVGALGQEDVAITSGRQLPKADATSMEQLVRAFNYPEESHIRSNEDLLRMGIKTFFLSDVCAAYDKSVYLKLGGFEHPLKTNEDMFYAAKVIQNGYKIAYVADARVYHSHNFSLKQQYDRNYVQGYEIERHKSLLEGVSQNSEGLKLVKAVSRGLLGKGRIISWVRFGLDCCARYLGSRAGRKAAQRECGATNRAD